jgi:uncharacterized membrane protein YkgB
MNALDMDMDMDVNLNRLAVRPFRPASRTIESLSRYSVAMLRVSLGLVFLGFGLLKFVPGLSPAEDLVERTMAVLTFGVIPAGLGLALVAAMETAIGLSLVTGKHLRGGLALLGLAMIGILSPVLLFPDRLFAGPLSAPTLEGQYVVKDIVLLAAGMVVAVAEFGRRRPVAERGVRRDG